MKKIYSILFALIFTISNPIISSASSNLPKIVPQQNSDENIILDDGIIIEYTLTELISNKRSNTKTAVKTATCKFDGNVIATIELTATFTYTGSSATCTNASATYSMTTGWSYINKTTSRNKNTATTSARIIKGINHADVNVTMKCSGSGVIS